MALQCRWCPVRLIVLLLLTSFAATHCAEPSWVVEDDRIDGLVSKEGQALTHAMVQLSSPPQEYSAITDEKGAFLIRGVAVGKYSFAVKDGERHTWRSEAGIEEQSIVPSSCFPRREDVFY
jgi:hypothetical protein